MRKITALALLLALAACGSDPAKGSTDLLKKGDLAGARAALEGLVALKPELKEPHYRLFLVYRLLSAQAGSSQEALMHAAISEYTWICKSEGIGADYQHMEESLKSSGKTKAAYEAAYALVYSR